MSESRTLSDDEKRRLIADLCGWREAFPKAGPPHPDTNRGGILLPYYWVNEKTHERRMELPDYLTDLNAMHDAEQILTGGQKEVYWDELHTLCGSWGMVIAPASKRAKALLVTLGKWTE